MTKKALRFITSKLRNTLSGKNDTFRSYQKPLADLCRHFNFRNVLEFGPGGSTTVILQNSPATILSFETEKKWFEIYSQQFTLERVKLEYREPHWDLSELDDVHEKFDLIFIDGGDRVQALLKSSLWLQDRGMVYLHDAHREEYEAGIRSFPYYHFIERHSCLLCNDLFVYRQLKSAFPLDNSCTCQYCSSPQRQAYLARMTGSEVST